MPLSPMIRNLLDDDLQMMLQINEQGLPGTGRVNLAEMAKLLSMSQLSLGWFDNDILCGFVICLSPNVEYGSLNYAWFNERYQEFVYVDRVAVANGYRSRGIGSELYASVFEFASTQNLPVTAEVSLNPPNPGSDRFHQRHGFVELTTVDYGDKAVTMYIRPIKDSDD